MKGILPEAIRNRKDKIGFATPEYEWLNKIQGDLKAYITNNLKEFINVECLLNDWDKVLKQQPRIGITPFWKFINLAAWMKVYDL